MVPLPRLGGRSGLIYPSGKGEKTRSAERSPGDELAADTAELPPRSRQDATGAPSGRRDGDIVAVGATVLNPIPHFPPI